MIKSRSRGVWSQILRTAPAPEIEELTKIIGKRMIETNEKLWQELSALKEIVADLLTFEFGNMRLIDNTPEKLKTKSKSKNIQHQDDFERDSDGDSPIISSHEEAIVRVQDSLSVSKISDVLEIVREAFLHEKSDLEAEIALLLTTMDSESEVISRGNTPRTDKSQNDLTESFSANSFVKVDTRTVTRKPSSNLESKKREGSMRHDTGPGPAVHKSVVVIGPGRIRRADSLAGKSVGKSEKRSGQEELAESLSLKLSDLSLNNTDCALEHNGTTTQSNTNSRAQVVPLDIRSSVASRGSRSRTRSRIETARDERFFMDEDVFMK